MPTLTPSQLEALGYTPDGHRITAETAPQGIGGREADLHEQITQWCRRKGYLVVHSRMDLPTTTAKGVPDFIIAMDGGRTLWVEAKAKGGKLRQEQVCWMKALMVKGHKAFTVWNWEHFLMLVDNMRGEK
jgi:hypothetical protein